MDKKNKAIIFDMDNTLIRSSIDFTLMKREVAALFHSAGFEIDFSLPVVKTIESFRDKPGFTLELEENIWQVILEIELRGMENALPEEGIRPVLEILKEHAYLLVVTNNHYQAAKKALIHAGLIDYFHQILGRGTAPALKPSPEGLLLMVRDLPDLVSCLVVGDASIDLEAAVGAGMDFVAYNGSRKEDWDIHAIKPLIHIDKWDKTAAKRILDIIQVR